MTNNILEKKIFNYDVIFDIKGAIFIKQNRLLVISDLHLGKSLSINSLGYSLPMHDFSDTLYNLKKIIKEYKPSKVISLGDNFHDKNSIIRFNHESICELNSITKIAEFIWIYGNHDKVLINKEKINGNFMKSFREKELIFTHEKKNDKSDQFEFSGHFHPKTYVSVNNSRFYYKCFVLGKNFCILPSFGSYTGGLDVKSNIFKKIIRNNANLIILGKKKIKQGKYLYDSN